MMDIEITLTRDEYRKFLEKMSERYDLDKELNTPDKIRNCWGFNLRKMMDKNAVPCWPVGTMRKQG